MDPILKATLELGQSVWLDYISRELMDSGQLNELIDSGVRGMTSNPTIFQQAISKSADYDRDIEEGLKRGESPAVIFEGIMVRDVQRACDIVRPVYDQSRGVDGYVSIEVSPGTAHDTAQTVAEAHRLWISVNRPNVMVKVPGTDAGMPAIKTLLAEGLNINITLLFSIRQYQQVLEMFLQAMEERLAANQPVERVASVASFFVSRVDNVADKQLEAKGHKELCGKAANANACRAYQHFLDVTGGAQWKRIAGQGARVQRPLWASTSTKNPEYSDVLYVQELIAEHTVNTMPLPTLEAFRDHGRPMKSLLKTLETAEATLKKIAAAGIDMEQVTHDLIDDGVKKFAQSYDQVLEAIEQKAKSKA